MDKILVTGGAGFIGSALVRLLARSALRSRLPLVVIDRLTYAGDLSRLKECSLSVGTNFKFYKSDICSKKEIDNIFSKEKPDTVVHLAAETHVDRSIQDADPFIETNIRGTQLLMDAGRRHKIKRFIFISTDEVYGETPRGKFTEASRIKPNSPYAASKAAADLLVQAYIRTYKFPAIIIRPCNNYGPWQFPEKLIPVAIASILKGKKVPVYARGENVREWLYVDDCAAGVLRVLKFGKTGEIYNLGSGIERKNIDTVKAILKNMGVIRQGYRFVKDRPGHDIRYSLSSSKIRRETGWSPKVSFKEGIALTVSWYLRHKGWLLSK